MKSALTLVAIISVAIVLSPVLTLKSYRNHKVVTFRIENEFQLKEIQSLELEPGFVFIHPPVQINMNIEVVIQPETFASFEEIAASTAIDYKITTNDLQSSIDLEKPLKNRKEGFALDQYNRLDDIYQFMDEMHQAYPETTTIYTIGHSYEGREIKLIKITTNENNPGVFIEANIHAREWISSATSVWLINELLTSTDPAVRAITDSVTWYIAPVTNPDGYEYTHEENRLWRKTRSVHNLLCRGVDPNRNFGFNWKMGGTSNVACSDTFLGRIAFSESEAKTLMDFYATVADKVDVYLAFHSAAQMILYPWGHTAEPVANANDLRDIAIAAAEALALRYGTSYVTGNSLEVLYVTSGSSDDHAYGHFNTPIVYTYEFRVATGTGSSFILPPEEIIPNSEEIFDSLLALITKSKELGYLQPLQM